MLNLLINDESIHEFVTYWRSATTLGRAAMAAADTLDELARIMGYEDRADLWTADEDVWENDSFTVMIDDGDAHDIDRIRRLPEIAADSLNRMLDAGISADDTQRVSRAAIELVRDSWGIP